MKRKLSKEGEKTNEDAEVEDGVVREVSDEEREFSHEPEQKKRKTSKEEDAKTAKEEEDVPECPYLDTINRKMLDFDFEKICSVTLRSHNVYACLVCGKYFQGRSVNSPAYSHSINVEHHVFMNLHNGKTYCLPEGYEVIDPSLGDIKYNLDPTYPETHIREMDTTVPRTSVAQSGDRFLAGVVGLNNLKANDGVNAIIQALVRVPPLRDFFLRKENLKHVKSPTVIAFGELVRKLFNARSFKSHVSPHEFMQTVADASNKRFRIGVHVDPLDFLAWFLNTLDRTLRGKSAKSIVSEVFQGRVEILSQQVKVKSSDDEQQKPEQKPSQPVQKAAPFMFLTVDIPTVPLFKDDHERNIIPQIPLYDLLSKFDGKTVATVPLKLGTVQKKMYRLKKLPKYLIIHVKRFSSNPFFKEKNSTIVSFPVKNLDLREYIEETVANQSPSTKYNLVASVRHEGKPDDGAYMVHALNRANGNWYDIHDLNIKEASHQEIPISESYIMIYENASLSDK